MKKMVFVLLFFTLAIQALAINNNDVEVPFYGSIYDVWTKKLIYGYVMFFDVNSFYYENKNNVDYPWLRPNVYNVTIKDIEDTGTNFNFNVNQDSYYLKIIGLSPNLDETDFNDMYSEGKNFKFPSTKYEFKDNKINDMGYFDGDFYNNIYLGKDDKKTGNNLIDKNYSNKGEEISVPIDPTVFGEAEPGILVKIVRVNNKGEEISVPEVTQANKEYYFCPDDLVDKSNCQRINYPGRFSFFVLPCETTNPNEKCDWKYKVTSENKGGIKSVESLGEKWPIESLEK